MPSEKATQDETQILQGEIEALRKRLDDRFREIAALTGLVEAAQERVGESATALKARVLELENQIRFMTLRHRVELQLQRIGLRVWTEGPGEGVPPIEAQIETLQQSDLFDEDWYRAAYPDLAEAGIGPIEHYLRAGAFEGRNPGPRFETIPYYMANPDVVEAGWPALVHYQMFGRAESRPLTPVLDAEAAAPPEPR